MRKEGLADAGVGKHLSGSSESENKKATARICTGGRLANITKGMRLFGGSQRYRISIRIDELNIGDSQLMNSLFNCRPVPDNYPD